LGAEQRRTILTLLKTGERPVMALTRALPVSGPAVSKHLRVLEEAGLVVRRKVGRLHLIALAPGALARAADFLGTLDGPRPTPDGLAHVRAQACALLVALATAVPILRQALALDPAPGAGPAAYIVRGIGQRLAGAPGLACRTVGRAGRVY